MGTPKPSERWALLSALCRSSLLSPDLQSLFEGALHGIAGAFGADATCLAEFDSRRNELRVRAIEGWGPCVVGQTILDTRLSTTTGLALSRPEAVRVADFAAEPERAGEVFASAGFRGALLVRIPGLAAPHGLLAVLSRAPIEWDAEDAIFLTALGDVLGQFALRTELERNMAEDSAILEAVFDGMAEGVVVSQSDGTHLLLNAAGSDLVRVGDVRASRVDAPEDWGIFQPDQRTRVPPDELPIRRAMTGQVVERTKVFVRDEKAPDGMWLDLWAQPVRGSDGAVRAAVAVYRDVTAEHSASARARRAQEDLQRVLDHSPYGAAVVRDGRWVWVNPAWAAALGLSPEDMVGHLVREHLDMPHDLGAGDSASPHGRVRFIRPDGAEGTLEIAGTEAIEFEGAPAALFTGRDVTEEQRLHAQLVTSDRMVSVGMLAAGVAHEINNPLAAVTVNLDLAVQDVQALADQGSAVSDLMDELRDARQGAERVRQIARDLRIFSRAEDQQVGPVDVQRVMESSLRMAWTEIRHRARLVKEYGRVPLVAGSEGRLGQVFLNLVVNAAQSIPEGHASENVVKITTGLEPDGRVAITVSDTGVGMPESVKARLFAPFFTTKPVGQGTGLGLSICRRIVTELGGTIAFESEVGCGTTFRVALDPIPAAGDRESELKGQAPQVRRARILVVDDDEIVARGLRRALSPPHDIFTERSGAGALARLAQGERFDLVLCDVMMPEMDGPRFLEALQAVDPTLGAQVIFMTGGAFTPKARAFLESTPHLHIEKPFDPHLIRRLVAERLR